MSKVKSLAPSQRGLRPLMGFNLKSGNSEGDLKASVQRTFHWHTFKMKSD